MPQALEVGMQAVLPDASAHYLSRVLRLGEGADLVLFNGDGFDYRCRTAASGPLRVEVEVLDRQRNKADSPLRITLSQALSRGERMDYCLQKATELGVSSVQLLISERVELKLSGQRLIKRLTHWRGVMQSASEQCGRATVPQLHPPVGLPEWLATNGTRLVLDADADRSLRETRIADEIDIAVGPEGGFSERELQAMSQAGVGAVRLGPRILRTETAGPAAIAVLQSMTGDYI